MLQKGRLHDEGEGEIERKALTTQACSCTSGHTHKHTHRREHCHRTGDCANGGQGMFLPPVYDSQICANEVVLGFAYRLCALFGALFGGIFHHFQASHRGISFLLQFDAPVEIGICYKSSKNYIFKEFWHTTRDAQYNCIGLQYASLSEIRACIACIVCI